jgi:hypothetical protein
MEATEQYTRFYALTEKLRDEGKIEKANAACDEAEKWHTRLMALEGKLDLIEGETTPEKP